MASALSGRSSSGGWMMSLEKMSPRTIWMGRHIDISWCPVPFHHYPAQTRCLHWVLPPLSNSWIIIIIWLYIALNRTPNIDCYWVGAVPNAYTTTCFCSIFARGGGLQFHEPSLPARHLLPSLQGVCLTAFWATRMRISDAHAA